MYSHFLYWSKLFFPNSCDPFQRGESNLNSKSVGMTCKRIFNSELLYLFIYLFFFNTLSLCGTVTAIPDSQLCAKLFSLWGLLLLGPFSTKIPQTYKFKACFYCFLISLYLFFFCRVGLGLVAFQHFIFKTLLQQNSDHMLPWLM